MSELLPQKTALTVFVGRSAELKQLLAGLDRAFDRRGGMFLLSGEPGIGKTRVAEQLDIEAQKRGSAVYWGRSTQAEGAPPYWPWVQILRSLLGDLGGAEFGRLAGPGLARILQVVPDLRAHFPSVATAFMDDELTRFGIYDSVTQLLLDTAATRPTVLVLDDLHWADTASLHGNASRQLRSARRAGTIGRRGREATGVSRSVARFPGVSRYSGSEPSDQGDRGFRPRPHRRAGVWSENADVAESQI